MSHLSESQLALHYYGDTDDPRMVERHLAECEACRREFQSISAVLSSVTISVPEPSLDYEARVWNKLESKLEPFGRKRKSVGTPRALPAWTWAAWRGWATAGAVAALIAAAFFLGRMWERALPAPGSNMVQADASQVSADAVTIRHRVLLTALEGHLDRTQLLLTELANADPAQMMDISAEETAARELLYDNRLYRQTAAQVRDEALVQVLDELERLLVDLSHRPATVSLAEWHEICGRIQSEGILFKIRVVGSEVRERERAMRAPAAKKLKT